VRGNRELPWRPGIRGPAGACSERRYGLKTNDYKTVWKLLVIERGHPIFVDALVKWVAAGGRVLFVTGNHDVEMYWPMVQDHVRFQLAGRRAAPAELSSRIAFEESWLVIDNVYVEHGHQYEPMTRVDGPPTLPPEHREINLPRGSFVNRYFINTVEALDPFIDNVKPVQESLLRLARQRPIEILSTYFGAWRFLRRALESEGSTARSCQSRLPSRCPSSAAPCPISSER
jgi:hypothetical protein